MFGLSRSGLSPPVQNHSTTGVKSAPGRRNLSPSSKLPRGQKPSTSPTKDASLSERYTNRSYNRQPSPLGSFRPSSGSAGLGLSPRSSSPSPTDKVASKQKTRTQSNSGESTWLQTRQQRVRQTGSHTEVEQRILARECQVPGSTGQRPKSSIFPRAQRHVDPEKSKVLLTVRDVLSRAVIENGKIDKNNIEIVLENMSSQLALPDVDEPTNIDVEVKQSKTHVNIPSVESISKRSRLGIGIVRKETKEASKVAQNDDKSSKQISSRQVKSNKIKGVVYVDLPDPDYSNFNSIVKKDEERLKLAFQNKGEKPTDVEITVCKNEDDLRSVEEIYSQEDLNNQIDLGGNVEEMIGDFDGKNNSNCGYWSAGDDARLQAYIETLVRQMNEEFMSKEASIMEGVGPQNTKCKAFCVCKVCISKRVYEEPSTPNVSEDKPPRTAQQKRPTSPRTNQQSIYSKSSQRKPTNKEFDAVTSVREIKRNSNFQPDSRQSIGHRQKTESEYRASYTVVAPGHTEEAGDDLYLRRRRTKIPVRKA